VIDAPPEDSVVGAVYVIAVPLGVEFVESVPHDAVGQETAQVTPPAAARIVTYGRCELLRRCGLHYGCAR
jgi:hypothetical protein